MRRLTYVAVATALVVFACAKKEQQPPMDSTAAAAMAPPAGISLADVAGSWTLTTWNEARDSALVTAELMATADTTGWMIHLPNRDPIPVRVLSVAGDSIVTEAGPYESVLRKGVKVWTHNVYRLQGGKLVGTIVAHYSTKGADSVRTLPTEGTRKS